MEENQIKKCIKHKGSVKKTKRLNKCKAIWKQFIISTDVKNERNDKYPITYFDQ